MEATHDAGTLFKTFGNNQEFQMTTFKQTLAAIFALLAIISLSGCGSDDDSPVNTDPPVDDGGGDGNDDDNGGDDSDTVSLQQQAVDNGQIVFFTKADSGLTFNQNTLAATTTINPAADQSGGLGDPAYFGAVDPAAADGSAWWQGWTVGGNFDGTLNTTPVHPLAEEIGNGTITPAAASACTTVNPDFTAGGTVTFEYDAVSATFPVCIISQRITVDTTLPNNHIFVLTGGIRVGNGGTEGFSQQDAGPTLTIKAGTQVYGASGQSFTGLIITRGANIQVNGTAAEPVIMAAVKYDSTANQITDQPSDLLDRGAWGGLIIDGFAKVNSAATAGGEVASEAVPSGQTRYFGGSLQDDDSGSVEYLIIAESGIAFRQDEEIQGLTLEGVGSGTTISYVQVMGSEDDGIEFFGGAAKLDHAVINGQDDDGLDMDLGYQGSIEFAIVRLGASNGNRGIESDNNGDNFNATPVTSPKLANITIFGNTGAETTTGALHREGFAGSLYRAVISDDELAGGVFGNGCVDIDDTLSQVAYRNAIFNCSPSNIAPADPGDDGQG